MVVVVVAAMLLRYAICAVTYAATMAALLICRSFVACTIQNMSWKCVNIFCGGGLGHKYFCHGPDTANRLINALNFKIMSLIQPIAATSKLTTTQRLVPPASEGLSTA